MILQGNNSIRKEKCDAKGQRIWNEKMKKLILKQSCVGNNGIKK